MANAKTVLILGGGIGGIVAATELRKQLPKTHRVVLIERESQHRFAPSYLWLMTGARRPDQISRPIARLAKQGIEIINGEIQQILPEKRTVVVGDKKLTGDYLVVALGAEFAPELVPGLADAGINLYTIEGACKIRDERLRVKAGRVVVLVSSMPFKCPAAPYEAAMLLDSDFRRRGLRDNVTIEIYTPEPGPMPVTGPEVSAQVRKMVETKGIGYFTQHTIKEVIPSKKTLVFTDGKTAPFDFLVYIPPHRAPTVVRQAGLTAESGWIPVDRGTLQTRFEGIYAIGDVTGIMLSNGKPLPKAGVFAHGQAEVVARNIAAAITGRGQQQTFDGFGECFLEAGDGRAGMGRGNFYAEPAPAIQLKRPTKLLHFGKVAFEKYWLFHWF